jgi:hypothetical protein
MIIDDRLEFADATSIGTPNNVTVNVGDVVDIGTVARDIGSGHALFLVINVTTTFASAGATLLSLILASDSTSTLSVDDTQTIHWESDSVDDAQYTAGKQFIVPLPSGSVPTDVSGKGYERFLGVQVRNRAAVAVTAGAIDAYLTLDPRNVAVYPDATN